MVTPKALRLKLKVVERVERGQPQAEPTSLRVPKVTPWLRAMATSTTL